MQLGHSRTQHTSFFSKADEKAINWEANLLLAHAGTLIALLFCKQQFTKKANISDSAV
jgi:hypothetical protein